MNNFFKRARSISYILSAILAGICLFAGLTGIYVEKTLFDSDFHKQLFEKNKIYEHAHNVINNSMTGFINDLKNNSPEKYEQHKEVFILLQKSTTPDMVQKNLDATRDGLFGYFKGEKRFLPDIYLGMLNEADKASISLNSNAANTITTQALSRISKINLGAILQYIDRNDIVDYLSILRFINYLFISLPAFILLVLLMLCLIALMLSSKFLDIARWLKTLFLTWGILNLVTGIALFIYTFFVMSGNIYPLTMSLPLDSEFIVSYIKASLVPLSTLFLVSGLLGIAFTAGVFFLQSFLPSLIMDKQNNSVPAQDTMSILRRKMQAFILDNSKNKSKSGTVIINALFLLSIITIMLTIGYKYNLLKKDFNENDFNTVMQKMKGVASVKEVIAAKDDAIYDVQIKLMDEKNNKPISDVQLYVVGKSASNNQDFNETALTDTSGSTKFSLSRGSFRISFNHSTFPAQYVMPTPIFFDLKAAGTKIITINLESVSSRQKWGIIEVEVLDDENKPVPNLQLEVPFNVSAPGSPDLLRSYTNSEGIAVFKINEGIFKVEFTESKFPKKYLLPKSIDVVSTHNVVTRYTYRLVDAPEEKPATVTPSPTGVPAIRNSTPNRR